jgi:YozE SAM-like fold
MSTDTAGRVHDPAQQQSPDQEARHQDITGPDQALEGFLVSIGSRRDRVRDRVLARDGFTIWLIAQAHRDDWIGDLARDVKHDTTWPRGSTPRLRELHDYLYDLHALDEAHAALDMAWSEWREVTT